MIQSIVNVAKLIPALLAQNSSIVNNVMSIKYILLPIVLLTFSCKAPAQQRCWILTLKANHQIVDVSLSGIRADSLVVTGADTTVVVAVADLVALLARAIPVPPPAIGPVTNVGLAVGAGLGVGLGLIDGSSKPSGFDVMADRKVTFGFAGAVLGTVAGSFVYDKDKDVIFDLTHLDQAQKVQFLTCLVSKETLPGRMAADLCACDSLRVALVDSTPHRKTGQENPLYSKAPAEASRNTTVFWRAYLGFSVPVGEFAGGNAADPAMGGAETGLYLDLDCIDPVGKTIDAVFSGGIARNGVSKNYLNSFSTFFTSAGPWWTITPMAGLEYRPAAGLRNEFYFLAQGGILVGITPSFQWPDQGGNFWEAYLTQAAFAYRIGAGMAFNKRVLVDLRLLSATPHYNLHPIGEGINFNGYATVPTQMIAFTIGIKF
jgi:hypothetical protein